ncbi:PREDICTED: protein-methionine sulfoxide oxidase Mical isoform X4 [Bactrocera latifrons]|uniref:protein-methionine sulfoxide oxidase Mical isoform X4 n=1 Tax=Bactrocera latifrons TaxID=174628 RepID=UPI0008DD4BE2|nr:PREDICTED: protein-methionine sulfoxide oxidase Mical isoform X4 [Bactrocera latifrons]
MSRPTQQRTMPQQKPPKQFLTEQEAIAASELFDLFCVATTMRQILGLHRDMCDILGLRPAPINEFYPMLKAKIRSWKAQALWKKFDARAAHRVYAKGTACNGTHVLVIGAGPCGLRTAIEAQLLGAKVVVLEKRDRITRNNVLHLWPFVITDLRNLGAKKFYGKFCAGSIDHISIRQLQIILIKVALLLGVEIHENVSFERTIEPSGDGFGWRAAVTPADHVVSYYEFDVLIGADGKRNTLEGFKRKEFRGKLAIAITANFINKKTEAEAKAEEISGVAFIFNQSFFKELYEKTGIDLENIVYYKDETHYFVMTAKKHSLIDKGVILQDFSDPAELLASANVSAEKLLDYAREAAEFSTKYQMPNLEFAVNHYGKPDVAMFDFTSMFAAETSCRVMLRHGHRLLQCLVGDSLLEPFWPTGSGCARGFLSSMDAAYATKLWSNPRNSIMGVVAQRESIYRLLNQTTPENLQRDTGSYTVDPASRYPNLNRTAVSPYQVKTLIDTDDPKVFEQPIAEIITTPALAEAPALLRKSRRSTDIVPEALLHWVCTQLHMYDFVKELQEPADILKNGKSLCALISRFRPDLIDYSATRDLTLAERNEVAFRILEAEYQLPRIMSGEKSVDLEKVDTRHWLHYLNQVREVFRGEVPYLKHPKMDISELREKYRLNNAHAQPDFSKLLQLSTKPKYPKAKSPIEDMVDVPQIVQRRSVLDEERVKRVRRHEPAAGGPAAASSPQQGQTDTPRRAKKRRNVEKAANISAKVALAFKKQAASEKCHFCKQIVYLMEKITAEDLVFHRSCLKCHHCHTNLRLGGYAFDRDDPNGRFYCTQHFKLPAKAIRPVVRKPGQRKPTQQQQAAAAAAAAVDITVTTTNAASGITQTDLPKTPDKLRGPADSVVQLDLLDRGQTPERIEFENTDAMSDGEPSEEHILDEHEWSGRNFLPESNQNSESDLSSSDDSDTESDADMFEEANDSPLAAQTLQLATDWIGKQHYSDSDDSDDFYDSSDGIADDDGKDDTEGEDFKKARELRREEVRLQPLPANLPTDTETEIQLPVENNESIENVEMIPVPPGNEPIEQPALKEYPKPDIDKCSENSYNSEKSFKSVDSFVGDIAALTTNALSKGPPPTKSDIEKLEQSSGRHFSAEIEAINEKLHRLNSVVKMSKDIETIAKENLVKSDILKKLTMKEKWLADNSASNSNPLAPKSAFENRFAPKQDVLKEQKKNVKTDENIKQPTATLAESVLETLKTELKSEKSNENCSTDIKKSAAAQKATSPEEVLASLKAEIKSASLNRQGSLKRQQLSPTASPSASKKPSASASRSNSFKNKATQENKESAKSGEQSVSRTNSLKRSEKFTSKDEVITNDSRIQIQNILGLVKSIDDSKDKGYGPNRSNSDMGKLFYDAESKFSPKVDRRLMQEKLKEIEAKSFSGTMDAIKSQMVVPTVSSQANPSVDLSKYFPDQKQQKTNSAAVNKNQKNLKDVDLAKYFPSSPTPHHRSAVVTVADKLKKSQTENAIPPAPTTTAPNPSNENTTAVKVNKLATKRQASLGDAAFSLRDHQLDGAVDLSKKSTPVVVNKDVAAKSRQAAVTTTTATAAVTKKGNVKIIKKIVPKKKVGGNATKKANGVQDKSIVPRDESDRVLDEILQSSDKEMHSPSAEYSKLFKEEKSPSEDLSDKIERMFQETGIDLGIAVPATISNKKRLLKTKSLGEGEFERLSKERSMAKDELTTKEDGDRPIGVQGLLARFESMSSVKSSEQSFKLRRMESTISNLNKSRESLISHDSIMSRESDSLSDLEKTMEYLKSEWRNEATNFLQKKRNNYFSKKRVIEEEEAAAKTEALKKSKYEDLPVQYRDSKFAKFFGIKSKSPEKIKTKSPEKKNVATTKKTLVNGGTVKKSSSPSKNLNKATETKAKMSTNLQVNIKNAKRKSPSPKQSQSNNSENTKYNFDKVSKPAEVTRKAISPLKSQMEDFETLLLVEKGSIINLETKVAPVDDQNIITAQVPCDPNRSNGVACTATDTAIQTKTLSRQNSNNSDNSAPETPVLKRRPLVEDIKNLPKTGCDKSLSNSRRNSAASLHSRRCSDVSLAEKLDTVAIKLTQSSLDNRNVDELFQNIVERLSNEHSEQNANTEEECDSLCTSISKSPSAAPTTVRMRGSSEDESIEKLFSQFSDEMLVNVEFDSNDELVGITPRIPLKSTPIEEDADFVDRLESLEKDEVPTIKFEALESPKASSDFIQANEHGNNESATTNADQKTLCNLAAAKTGPLTLESIQTMLYMEPQEMPFPVRPQRRQKSTSSSSEASAPIAPQRIKHKLAKLCPDNMPPSVQDLMQTTFTKSLTAELAANGGISIHKFPRNISEDELEDVKESHYQNQPVSFQRSSPLTENTRNVQSSNSVFNEGLPVKDIPKENSNVVEIKQTEDGKINDMQTIKDKESRVNYSHNKQPTKDITSNVAPKVPVKTDTSISQIITKSNETEIALRRNSQASIDENTNNVPESPEMQRTLRRNSQVPIDEKASNATESLAMQRNQPRCAIYGQTINSEAIPNTPRLSKSSVLEQTTSPLKQSPLLQRKLSQSSTDSDKLPTLNDSKITQRKPTQNSNVDLGNSPLMQWRLLQAASNSDSAENLSTITNLKDNLSGDNTKTSNSNEILSVPNSSKASSKERSLEWDMTKMPASPMPRRKFIHAERRGLDETRIKDVSPTSSIRLLNNISSNSSDSDERRIIEEFEMERRQALIQRDKEYKELEKNEREIENIPKVKKPQAVSRINSNNNSKCTTPRPTPLSSRRGTQDSISTQREVTPPNFKKLVIPAETDDLPSLSSRCSSFAFIELMSNGEAREAPMPEKLKIPTKPQPIVLPEINEPIAEVFQNRPWPKPELSPEIDMSDSPDTVIEVKRANSAPRSPVAEVFRNRKWPDGKTVFNEVSEQYSDDDDFIRKISKNRSKYRKMQSHSPQPTTRHRLATDELSDGKMSSKSITDLRKDSPITSIYEAEPSLNFGTRSSASSLDNSSTHTSISGAPKRPVRHIPVGQTPEQTIDANTRMLLDRSKRLHNRKSEFINERAAERNPYLRDVVNAERIEREALDAAEDELECYRPSGYKSKQLTRFPTSRTLGRDHSRLSNSHYSYTPSYNSDYALSNRRLYGTPTLPYTSTTSLNHNPYLTTGSAAYGGALGRSMHFNDYTRRSPSRHREREHSKESCVIA